MEENNISMKEPINDDTSMESNEEVNSIHLVEINAEDLANMKQEIVEQKDKYLRLVAEFDNYKRRTSKERVELMQTAGKEIITSLLEVLDDADRAEKQLKASGELSDSTEGTLLVFNKLRAILQQKGLKSMESIHHEFDVEKHEAITEIDCPEELKGKVIDELEKGFYLNEKLIRFAKVVVGK